MKKLLLIDDIVKTAIKMIEEEGYEHDMEYIRFHVDHLEQSEEFYYKLMSVPENAEVMQMYHHAVYTVTKKYIILPLNYQELLSGMYYVAIIRIFEKSSSITDFKRQIKRLKGDTEYLRDSFCRQEKGF